MSPFIGSHPMEHAADASLPLTALETFRRRLLHRRACKIWLILCALCMIIWALAIYFVFALRIPLGSSRFFNFHITLGEIWFSFERHATPLHSWLCSLETNDAWLVSDPSFILGFGRHVWPHGSEYFLPIWPLVWLSFFFAVRSFTRSRPFPKGHCQICNYDLRATPERCPECGTPVQS